MVRFEITMKDDSTEIVDGATAYAQEGQLTTFFRAEDDRGVLDAWSTRVLSVRTAEIVMIRRRERSDVVATASGWDEDSSVRLVSA